MHSDVSAEMWTKAKLDFHASPQIGNPIKEVREKCTLYIIYNALIYLLWKVI